MEKDSGCFSRSNSKTHQQKATIPSQFPKEVKLVDESFKLMVSAFFYYTQKNNEKDIKFSQIVNYKSKRKKNLKKIQEISLTLHFFEFIVFNTHPTIYYDSTCSQFNAIS